MVFLNFASCGIKKKINREDAKQSYFLDIYLKKISIIFQVRVKIPLFSSIREISILFSVNWENTFIFFKKRDPDRHPFITLNLSCHLYPHNLPHRFFILLAGRSWKARPIGDPADRHLRRRLVFS